MLRETAERLAPHCPICIDRDIRIVRYSNSFLAWWVARCSGCGTMSEPHYSVRRVFRNWEALSRSEISQRTEDGGWSLVSDPS